MFVRRAVRTLRCRPALHEAMTIGGLAAAVEPCLRSFAADGEVMSYRTTTIPPGLLRRGKTERKLKFSRVWFLSPVPAAESLKEKLQ